MEKKTTVLGVTTRRKFDEPFKRNNQITVNDIIKAINSTGYKATNHKIIS
jgi:hypothetical protein